MAGEYYRWLARDVKPAEKKELTKEEKRRNWWDYHKWHVVIAIVCAVLLADLVSDAVRNKNSHPDYVVAYVGQTALPDGLAEQVELGLGTLGQDLNGNGAVSVELRQFILADESLEDPILALEDMERSNASSMLLLGNIETVESVIFLLENPALFLAQFPVLSRADGTRIEETPDSAVPVCYRWADCPVLAGLELENFEVPVIGGTVEGDSQLALSELFVARRGLWDDAANDPILGAIALWEQITEGAQ